MRDKFIEIRKTGRSIITLHRYDFQYPLTTGKNGPEKLVPSES